MTQPNAQRAVAGNIVASTFGILAGIGGFIHGVGEVRQGNVPSGGYMIDSWTSGPIATHMDGDPALTLLPNVLAAGVLTIISSAAVILWAAFFVHRRNGGRILLVLSATMLLVGGGVGGPVIGLLAGWAGTSIHAPLTWWGNHLSQKARQRLARLWPWAFGIAAASAFMLVVGALLLIYAFDVGNADLYFSLFLFTVVALIATVITGIGHDLTYHKRAAVE
jgi:hypothetical protein